MNSVTVSTSANAALIEEYHQRWLDNPDSVDPTWRAFFQGFTLGGGQLAPSAAPAAGSVAIVDSLKQASVHYLINAYRAIPADREGLVQLTLETEPEHIVLRVRDNGQGIPADQQKQVFDFGYTTKEGTGKMQGVGLYHSRLIAETHKGNLSVESKQGEWTEFTLQLPYVSPATIEFKTADWKRGS